jgi:dihydrofolate synthase/folylpolyglutamate synthase
MTAGSNDPVQWLYDLQHSGIKLGLENIRQLLECMGHPEEHFTPVLIGGTNGKGSVTAMMDAILRACGVRVGMFTSPHLVRINERIRINGLDIATPDLERHLNAVRNVMEQGMADGRITVQPSFFETIAATAIRSIRKSGVTVGLLEIGLGGRLDATNAVDNAELSIIVSIDYDHTKSLGPTLTGIAFEKGGIIKEGKPVVCGVHQEKPRQVLQEIARQRSAPFIDILERSELCTGNDALPLIRTDGNEYSGLRLALQGEHQWHNARCAIVALEALATVAGFRLTADGVARGLADTRWAGRLQTVPGTPVLLLDGAHNPAGVATLTRFLKESYRGVKPVLLFGATREKELDQVLQPLAPYVSGLVASQPEINRAMEATRIADYSRDLFTPVLRHPSPKNALQAARDLAGPDGMVLVAGSLYLVGRILELLENGKD